MDPAPAEGGRASLEAFDILQVSGSLNFSIFFSQCDCSCVPWAIQGVSALSECDSVALQLQRVVTGVSRLKGPEGGREGTFGKLVGRRAEGEGVGG